MSEASEQTALFQWAMIARQEHKELELLYHVPNGGRRDKREAVSLRRQGVKAGIPDIVLPVARDGFFGLYIELKFGKNKTSSIQDVWIRRLRGMNYKVEVCYGWVAAREVIECYLDKKNTVVMKCAGGIGI